MQFHVGDLITGNEQASTPYSITTHCGLYEVIDISRSQNDLAIRVVNHEDYPHYIDEVFTVDAEYFVPVYSSKQTNQASIDISLFQ